YSVTLAAPFVDGTTNATRTITITAKDRTGNPSTATASVIIVPNTANNPPSVSFTCLTSGAIYPFPYSTTIQISASVASPAVLQSVELLILDGQTRATLSRIPASSVSAGLFSAVLTAPDAADGMTFI